MVLPTFSISEAAEQLGLPAPRLHYFMRLGAVVPAQPSEGRGTPVRLSTANLYELLIAEYFWDAGLTAAQVVQLLGTVRAKVAAAPVEKREATLFDEYRQTLKLLARVFGKGKNYDTWEKAADATYTRLMNEAKQRTAAKKQLRKAAEDLELGPSLGLLATLKQLPPNALRTRHVCD